MGWGNSERRALFVLLIGSMVGVYLVVRPLAESILIGAVFSMALWPLHRWLSRKLHGHPGPAAVLVLLALVLLVLGPLVGMSTFIVQQAVDGVAFVIEVLRSEGADALIGRLPDFAEEPVRRFIEGVSRGQGAGNAFSTVTKTIVATGTVVFQTVMALLAMFFFLTKKEEVLDWLAKASPLEERQTRELLAEVRKVSVAVLRSTVLTSGVQSLAALVGYLIAGVPYWAFFTGVTFFFGLIPGVGASVVCLATAAILLALGKTVAAIFLAIWGLLVVGLSDNLVKPLLMSSDVRMHPLVILFALLGGLSAFGPIGLVAGPLAVALFVAVLRIYRRDYGGEVPGGGPIASPSDLPT